ncbi:DUF7882 family protein [Microbacterium aureliae]
MGKLVYGNDARSLDIDDRVLAHLRLVFMNKLRRLEPFMFHYPDPPGIRTLWIHPAVPIVFHFYGSRTPRINRAWVNALMLEAAGPHGLRIVPEPEDDASAASQ